ncbi:phosphomethylpyrimidine synthase [Candidatus Velamenicoccus archaeovorus]|uniref:Phosphomethylpyrimidine synthase n=1 Tax=Velamenicoccus archaeovorus TaxID=1930593 RepID=A0A410P403_VELA1|nr:phosphomethylpyrimidine synthase ThiC [Candidatus Velamenicoccus archaeovorus]QAT16909.1 phosphomethylpyrimidine synthase [Candidatus Velamenicoccus archaeovorus]
MYNELLRDEHFRATAALAAEKEKISCETLLKSVAAGRCVIPLNNRRQITSPCGIGENLSTKINVNLGTSPDKINLKAELEKLALAVDLGADAVMDLSLGGDLKKIRRSILEASPLPVGTVPIYEAAMGAQKKRGSFLKMEAEDIFDVLEGQACDGVDFFTIHCGINKKSLEVFLKSRRLLDIVSRGGAILVNWMRKNGKENPLFEYFDRVLDIARRYRITLSLGDGMRPGCIADATDAPQIAELKELGKLTQRARKAGVQVIIEGPGHIPLHEIKKNMELEKKICDGAPFYVLGPLVTDIGAGYDHITGAIGGALAAYYGADFLCYLTPAEHIRHPSVEDTRQGIVASKIAAHAADIARGLKGAAGQDRLMAIARKHRDWQKQIRCAIDPKKTKEYKLSSKPKTKGVCTMCGEFCSIRLIDTCLPTRPIAKGRPTGKKAKSHH